LDLVIKAMADKVTLS